MHFWWKCWAVDGLMWSQLKDKSSSIKSPERIKKQFSRFMKDSFLSATIQCSLDVNILNNLILKFSLWPDCIMWKCEIFLSWWDSSSPNDQLWNICHIQCVPEVSTTLFSFINVRRENFLSPSLVDDYQTFIWHIQFTYQLYLQLWSYLSSRLYSGFELLLSLFHVCWLP